MNPWGLAFVGAGLFTIIGAVCDWDWFMNHPKARFVCAVCGRGGARIFYVVFGIAFVIFGALFAAGVIHDTK
ncbi:immunity 17 family protein [Humisphaera borealis]|uniref:Immunity 17 family protein n=1 Tax=Humisphaera borealis TaxID=2807512 RepID=A0A7M2WVJ0_9BACT|nr:immunity 17 family protein [Humisphaera borealis]QOV89344.1 immunity 17 family protein [Humisphaera borealis]